MCPCTREEVEEAVRRGSEMLPLQFPNDSSNRAFPVSLLCSKLPNGEDVPRDWLVWSKSKQALFCFPCRLFTQSSTVNRSLLALSTGYSKNNKWKKLYVKIPEHQESMNHKRCYVAWRNLQKIIGCSATIPLQLHRSIQNEAAVWKQLLHRFLLRM